MKSHYFYFIFFYCFSKELSWAGQKKQYIPLPKREEGKVNQKPTGHDENLSRLLEAYYLACSQSGIRTIKLLIEQNPEMLTRLKTQYKKTALHLAALNGNLEIVKFLTKNYSELIMLQAKKSVTALHLASLNGHLETVQFLTKNYPKLTLLHADDGLTALHLASINGHLETVQFLTKNHPKLTLLNADDGLTVLHLASLNGHLEIVQFLAEHHPKLIMLQTHRFETALHLASLDGHLEIVQFLIENYPELTMLKTVKGKTALYYAIKNAHEKVIIAFMLHHPDFVRALSRVENPENKNILRFFSLTGAKLNEALHDEDRRGDQEVVNLVLLMLRSPELNTQLHHAAVSGNQNVFQLFKTNTQLMRMRDSDGTTVLHRVVQLGLSETACLLLENDPLSLLEETLQPVQFKIHNGEKEILTQPLSSVIDLSKYMPHMKPFTEMGMSILTLLRLDACALVKMIAEDQKMNLSLLAKAFSETESSKSPIEAEQVEMFLHQLSTALEEWEKMEKGCLSLQDGLGTLQPKIEIVREIIQMVECKCIGPQFARLTVLSFRAIHKTLRRSEKTQFNQLNEKQQSGTDEYLQTAKLFKEISEDTVYSVLKNLWETKEISDSARLFTESPKAYIQKMVTLYCRVCNISD